VESFPACDEQDGLTGYVEEILRSGFPGIRDLAPRAHALQLDSYVSRIVDHELAENGISVRRPAALRVAHVILRRAC
jgi:hypothetical protein